MANPNQSQLDLNQALKRCIDSVDDTLRIEVGSGTTFEIATDAASDSMAVRSLVVSNFATLNAESSGILIASLDVEGYREFQIMTKITSAITGTASLVLEVSPSDSAEIWIATPLTQAVTGSTDLISAINTSIAKRIRLSISSTTLSAGDAEVYLMARG